MKTGAFRWCLVALLLCTLSTVANAVGVRDGAVSGRVVDQVGKTIPDATVTIAELSRAATSGADGSFRFGAVPRGRYTIAARRLGYVAVSQQFVVSDAAVNLTLTLTAGALNIEPVNVTATREPVAALASPLQTSVLTGDQVHPEGGISLAHSVAQLAGVRNMSSGQEIGKPMIRGLFGPRILVLADGSRMEDYSWSDEDGPSMDARLAQRIEVIRGPASVLYGSEALGGVVNVVPAELPYSADGSRVRNRAIEAYGASNNIELGSAAMIEGAQSRYGWRGFATGRFSQNYSTPGGAVQNSSFWAFNGEGAFGMRGDHGSTTLRAAHYGGEFHLLEASGPEPGDPTGGPVRQVADDRLQMTNEYLGGGIRLETKAQWQRHSLTEVSDDCVPAPGETTCVKVKDKVAFALVLNTGTLDVLAHHTLGDHVNGTVGVSGMYQLSSSSGPIFLVPSATISSAAAFAFEQATLGPLTFVAGGRADTRSLSSDATPQISRAADDRSWSATSGDVGVVFRPVAELAFVANFGMGWRAPTLFDLYTNGPNLADARFEIGDPTLKTERAKNLDGGVRWASDHVHAAVSFFDNTVDDFIYTTPTTQFQNGLRVFRHVQADARLTGAEASVEAQVSDEVSVRASYDFVDGTDRRTDTPLPLMPPPRAILGTTVHLPGAFAAHKTTIGGELEFDQKQTRLNANDFATGGYTLLNLDLGFDQVVRSRQFRFDFAIRNATNSSYRDFLSRYKEFALGPGVNVIFKASTGAW